MRAYSEDLRTKVAESVRRGVSKSETAQEFGVDRSTVRRYLKQLDEDNSLVLRKRLGRSDKENRCA